MKFRATPHKRGTIRPTGIVLHHSGGSYLGGVEWILNPISKVSYHYLINTDGRGTQFALPTERTWHAGVSSFKGRRNCNDFMIGISVSGDTTKRILTTEEIEAVGNLCIELMKKYNFGVDNITTHAEISPGRKNDVDTRAKKAIIQYIINEL
jgi:N-acetyl-anhydromuramyl-L-alanine amidase AmpD